MSGGVRDVLALLGRRVAGAHGDGGRRERRAEALGRERDAGERRAQVLLDVDGERAQRRDVEDAAPLALGRHRRVAEAVDRREERGERLAGAGGREEEGVVAGRDGRPALLLGAGGRGEAGLEPRPGGRGEAIEHAVRHRSPRYRSAVVSFQQHAYVERAGSLWGPTTEPVACADPSVLRSAVRPSTCRSPTSKM